MNEDSLNYISAIGSIFSFNKVLMLFIGLLFLYLLSRFINKLSKRIDMKISKGNNLVIQIATLVNFFLSLFGGAFVIYYSLKPPQEVAIAVLGSATVAIGLSLKDLVASLISGIAIITDPPFRVGDRILYKNFYGEVKHIGLRAVRILTLDNQMVTIPNSNFMNDAVISQNPGKRHINVVTPFYVNINADVDYVKEILRETVYTSRYAYLGEPIVIVAEQVTYADVLCLKFLVKAHVHDAKNEKEFQTDLYDRALKQFSDKGILAAFLYKDLLDIKKQA